MTTSNRADSAWISRRKSSAANRPSPRAPGQGVGRRRQGHPGVGQPGQQRRHQHRVAGVVELELVDADQPVAPERLDGLGEAQRADQVGEADEGAERLGPLGGVPEGGQQVGLADAEAAVEVDAPRGRASLRRRNDQRLPAATAVHGPGETLEVPDRGRLAGLGRVGSVGGEPLGVEPRGRHQLGDQALRRDLRSACGQAGAAYGLGHGASVVTGRMRPCTCSCLSPVGPAAGPTGSDDDALARLYAYPHRVTPRGRGCGPTSCRRWTVRPPVPDGRSGSINTGADREVFALLRALADVVVIGAGTARAEGYRRVVTRTKWRARRAGRRAAAAPGGRRRQPVGAGAAPAGRAAGGLRRRRTCSPAPRRGHGRWTRLAPRSARTTSSCTARTPSTWPPRLADLARRGMTRVLSEGGPHLMRDLVAAGLLDELCLTLVPDRDRRRAPAHHRRSPGRGRPAPRSC